MTWKLINSEIKQSNIVHNKVTKLIINNKDYVKPQEVCEIFNDHFIGAVDNLITPNITPDSS